MKNLCKVDNIFKFFLFCSYAVYRMPFYIVERAHLCFHQHYGKVHLPIFCARECFCKNYCFFISMWKNPASFRASYGYSNCFIKKPGEKLVLTLTCFSFDQCSQTFGLFYKIVQAIKIVSLKENALWYFGSVVTPKVFLSFKRCVVCFQENRNMEEEQIVVPQLIQCGVGYGLSSFCVKRALMPLIRKNRSV